MASREEVGNLVVKASLDSSGFREGMQNLNRQMSVVKSEFKAASAALGPFATEEDKLKLRAQELGQEMDIQKQRVESIAKAYADSAASAGEDATATQRLAVQLNHAKAALSGMHNDLEVTNEKLREARTEELSFRESVEGTKEGIEATHAALIGMMGIMAGGMISEFTEGAEQTAIQLQTLQQETGDSQQSLERLSLIASGAGVDMGQLGTMIGRMDKSIQTAQTPTKGFMDALHTLGISAEEFSKAPISEQAQMIQEAMDKSNLPAKQLNSTLKALGVTSSELQGTASHNLLVIQQSMQNANTSSKTFQQSLNELGISAKSFDKASPAKQAKMIADAMDQAHLPANKLNSALKGLGLDITQLSSNSKQNLQVIKSSLEQTASSGSTLARQFAQAGINLQQFAAADTEGKIQMLGKYMEETKNKTQATALVMSVFGRQGQQMLPLIQNFAELDGYAKQLKMPVMDTHEIQLAAEKTKMLQTAMQMMMDSVLVKVLPLVDSLGKAFYNLVANINHPIHAITQFEQDLGPIPTLITAVVAGLAGMKVINGITSTLSEFKNSIMSTVSAFKALILVEAEEEGEKVLQLRGWIQGIGAIVKNTVSLVADTAATIAHTTATIAQTAATKAAEIAQAAFNLVMDANPIMLVVLAVGALIAGIILLVKHWQTVTHWLSEVWQWFKHLGTGVQATIAIFMPFIGLPMMLFAHWGQVSSFFRNLISHLKTDWNDLVSGAMHWGENLINMIAQGIENGIARVKKSVTNIAHTIKSFLGFGSPTEDGPGATSDHWMPNLMNMLVEGVQSGTPKLRAVLSQAMEAPNYQTSLAMTRGAHGAAGFTGPEGGQVQHSVSGRVTVEITGSGAQHLSDPHFAQAVEKVVTDSIASGGRRLPGRVSIAGGL